MSRDMWIITACVVAVLAFVAGFLFATNEQGNHLQTLDTLVEYQNATLNTCVDANGNSCGPNYNDCWKRCWDNSSPWHAADVGDVEGWQIPDPYGRPGDPNSEDTP